MAGQRTESRPPEGRRVPSGPAGATALPRPRRSPLRRDGHVLPALLLAVWTVAVWARPALRDFAHLRLANPGDSESFAWYLSWNVHALTHGENPFRTPNLYAPDGMDLGNAISVPAVSLLVAPVTAAFGGTAGYNTAFLLALFLAGLAVYGLARELTGSVVGATVAGALTVVMPYFSGHALGHLNLLWIAGLPFLAMLAVRAVRGRLRAPRLVLLTALTVAFTFGASTELVVTQGLFGAVALVVALVVVPHGLRPAVLRAGGRVALGAVLGAVLALPVIVAALSSGIPDTVANSPAFYSTDLTNLVAPTESILIGDSFFTTLRDQWYANSAENTAYVPLTVLALAVAAAVVRPSRLTAGLWLFALVGLGLSLGPYLTIAGTHTVPLPWQVAEAVPGLDHALPVRFSAFVFMALAVLVAHAWAVRALPRRVLAPLAGLPLALLLPNLPAMAFPAPAGIAPFVEQGDLERLVDEGENVLVLPAGQWGPGMRWQDELDFSFVMPTGNGGGASAPPMLRTPLGTALFAEDLTYDYPAELPDFLDDNAIDTVLVDAAEPEWRAVMDTVFPGAGREAGGVWVYPVP